MLVIGIYCVVKYIEVIGIVEDILWSLSKCIFFVGINGVDIMKLDEIFLEYLCLFWNLRYLLWEKCGKFLVMDIIIYKEMDVVIKILNWRNIFDEIYFDLFF